MHKSVRIRTSVLEGAIEIPPSKSHTIRALVFATMAKGKSIIRNYLPSPDIEAAVEACRLLGSEVVVFPDRIEVIGHLKSAENVIQAGNSGQVVRFFGAIASLTSTYTLLTGDESIRHRRPLQPLIDGLSQLGCFAASSRGDGYAPLIVRGPLQGGKAIIDGADSQPVSALLMAAAFAPYPTELLVRNPGELPWVAMTLDWFDRLGIPYQNHQFEAYSLPGSSLIEGFEYVVPGDWSTAAYPIVAALITGSELVITGIDFVDVQGDREIVTLLQGMGGRFEIGDHSLKVLRDSELQGRFIDVNCFIDALPLLAVLGCFAKGETEIVGGRVARYKESDRIHAMVVELQKMGAKIIEKRDGMIVQHSPLWGASMGSYADHRIALALTTAALGAVGESQICGVDCVEKSFPQFVEKMTAIGAHIA